MTTTKPTPELTREEASRILIDGIPDDLGVRRIVCEIDEADRIVWWTANVFDPYMPEGRDVIGTASFAEHYPSVDIWWTTTTTTNQQRIDQ